MAGPSRGTVPDFHNDLREGRTTLRLKSVRQFNHGPERRSRLQFWPAGTGLRALPEREYGFPASSNPSENKGRPLSRAEPVFLAV